MSVIFTKEGYKELKKIIERTQKSLDAARKSKNEAASGQDGWHDEGYKTGVGEEMTWSKRLGELQELMFNAQVIEPEEQNINVQVGNGVEIRYYDGTTFRFILEGYWLGSLENRVSVYGPLGQALFGAKKGEKRTLKLDREEKNIIVIDIILPSIVKKTYKN